MTALPLDRFRTIGLDDLVARAEMLTRIDRKYLLTPTEAGEFLNRLTPSTEALSIDGSLAARYATVYFDTSDWASFRMSAHQRRVRMKVRTRTYVDSGVTFLEVKSRGASGVGSNSIRPGLYFASRTWASTENSSVMSRFSRIRSST